MNTTSQALPDLNWIPVAYWTQTRLVGLSKTPGLIRFLDGDEIVYIGMEARGIANFGNYILELAAWQTYLSRDRPALLRLRLLRI